MIVILFPFIELPEFVVLELSVLLNPTFPVNPSWAFAPSIVPTPALAVIPPDAVTPNPCSSDVFCELEIFTSFLASSEMSFPSISTPFKLISPSVALKLISPPDLILVVFSLVVLDLLSLYENSPVTDEVLATRSPNITFDTEPATCAAVSPSLTCPAWAFSAICIPLFTASAILLVVVFPTFTPSENPLLVSSFTSVYLVLSISLAVILKSFPVVKSAPPISVVPPDLIFKSPPVWTFPSVHVVLFLLVFFVEIPTVTWAFVNESI